MNLKPFTVLKERTTATNNPHLSVIDATLLIPDQSTEVTWSYIKTKDAVVVFALDDENNVYLKREWRLARKDFIWELPAGFIEDEDPTPQQITDAANRELQEEVGMKSNTLEKLLVCNPSNYMTMKSHLFLAKDLVPSKLNQDEHEYLEVKKLPIKEAYELILKDQAPGTTTILAFEIILKCLNLS